MDLYPIHLAKNAATTIEASIRSKYPNATRTQIAGALRVWQALLPHLQVDSFILPVTAADIHKELGMQSGRIANAMRDLDNAGVLKRAPFPSWSRRGNQKAILINPKFAYVARTQVRYDLFDQYEFYDPGYTKEEQAKPIDEGD